MGFRIKVYLYNVFIDYRKMCLVYVNNDINTIQDLINYISKNFQIDQNVYLMTLEGLYLPGFEDVRILHDDDVVVVFPQSPDTTLVTEPRKSHKRQKPSKGGDQNKSSQLHSNILNEDVSNAQSKLKRKKATVTSEDDWSMIVDDGIDCTDHPQSTRKKKKKQQFTREETTNCTEAIIKKEDVVKLSINRITPSLVREYTRNKKVDLLPISTTPKLVKPIIVYDDVPKVETNEKESESSSDSDVTEETDQHLLNKTKEETPNAVESNEAVSEELNGIQQKVKRKRKRTRKPKPSISKFTPTNNATCTLVPVVSGAPRLHIRFDEVTQAGQPENVGAQAMVEIDEYKPKNILVNYQDLCEKEIVRFPVMQGVYPKVHEMIAFKRYKLSESYTPEISNYIIGRVCSYSAESSTVVVSVLEGRGECRNPRGKFSLEDELEIESAEQQFHWNELIEPRLLYP